MAEYIKRSDALKVIETANSMVSSLLEATMKLCVTMDRIAAADVAPVVRCGECKLYGGRPWENDRTGICARTDFGVMHDDFCSYGKRKDGDGDD